MNKKVVICLSIIFVCILTATLVNPVAKRSKTSSIKASVLKVSGNSIKVMDKDNIIYTFVGKYGDLYEVGDNIKINYDGKLNKATEKQSVNVLSTSLYDEDFLSQFDDDDIFSNFYNLAYNKLKTLSLDEKIGQIFLVRLPDKNQIEDLKKYKFGGYVLYEKDFKDKTKQEVINMIDNYQAASKIPLLIAVDEEGGKVIRISSNPNLVKSPFKSPSELYQEGGMNLIKQDTINKTDILEDLGINVNLAPVVDVATDPESYIYDRTIKEDTKITSEYAKTVINASKGSKVSYVLKHFPGYGDNADTHESKTTDNRTYSKLFEDDIPPFRAGIKAKAEAVLVSHNIVPALDKDNPASLSASVHNVLRNELSFTGIIMTDDINMKAITDKDAIRRSILAGNDLIIATDYENAINDVKKDIENGNLTESIIDKMTFKVLAWKYYKGLMYDMEK